MTKLTPPLKWAGGKHYLAKKIVALMPSHTAYIEPYAGGLAVLLEKDPEGVSEVANDLNYKLTNFWCILQDPGSFDQFLRLCETTPFSEVEWKQARDNVETDLWYELTCVERAHSFFVYCRQSLAGRMKGFATLSKTRTRRGRNEQVSAWMGAIEGLPEVSQRLLRVAILDRPAIDVIRKEDSPNSLFYLDSPYLHETRVTTTEYGDYEMSVDDHKKMLEVALQCKGKVMISGYPSELYADKLHKWKYVDFDIANHASGSDKKNRMTERLWMNY